ncbi:ATP-binding protein [Maricaulis sp.]|uniref:ATP-binding protein n=1 Tax=Maricaulis sp. TaxID=1486257 RepID=UPI0026269148|nr:ATP-binding protein [Maricaulis sp.]
MKLDPEQRRLAALHALGLLDTEPESEFDALTDLAVGISGARMAAISLIDANRQWFKSNINIPAPETPRNVAFCDHAIRQDEVFYIPDATADERFCDNPLVTGEPNIRGYAGMPIKTPDGFKIGTLCVIDDKPMDLDEGAFERLRSLAGIVEIRLAERLQHLTEMRSNRMLGVVRSIQTDFISNQRDIEGAFSRLLDSVIDFTQSQDGFIGEVKTDGEGRFLEIHSIQIKEDDSPEAKAFREAHGEALLRFRNTDSLLGLTLKSEEPVFANDIDNDPRSTGTPAGHFDLDNFMSIPLMDGDEMIAIVGVANRTGGYHQGVLDSCTPLLVTITNLIRARRLEDRERGSVERLRTVTESGGIGSWEVDLLTGHPVWDDITKTIHEVPLDYEPVMETAINFYAPEARKTITDLVQRGIETGEGWDVELPLITAKGNRIWVRAVGRPIMEEGSIVKLVGSFQDITERRLREEELKSLSSRLALALDTSGVGVWEHDLQTQQHYWDEETARLFGRESFDGAITMDDWLETVHPDDLENLMAAVNTSLEEHSDYEAEYRAVLPDGSIRYIRSRGVFRQKIDGGWVITGINMDVTRDVETALELDRRRKDAEAASEAKTQFLANLSHEIRTPLNGVMGMAQLLRLTELDVKQTSFVDTLQTSGRALLDVIEDILDISKIEAGMIDVVAEPFDLPATLRSVLDMVWSTAREKDLDLTLDVGASVPQQVIGDQKRLRQVLINIIGNAVKFTSTGSVKITAREFNGRVRFEVRDTGPGIPADQVERIFDRFAQVDDSSTRRHGGTGLGLAICRELVSLAGGDIGVTSEFGVGTEFWFELPLPQAGPDENEDACERLSADTGTDGTGDGRRILVVDDVQTNQMVAASLLRNAGHEVELAGNGREAIEALEHQEFDAVLMDIQMPVMSGDEAIRKIRGSGKPYASVPIFAVTADATKGADKRYLAAGATGYLSKPLDLKAVSAALVLAFSDAA